MGKLDRIDRATIFLLRHGRTALNADGALRGRVDTPLGTVGRQQAARLADLFADSGLTSVVSSPLRRATATATPLAARFLGEAYEVSRGPISAFNDTAIALAAKANRDRRVIERARREAQERLEASPDQLTKQVASLLRRALELGEWDWT